MPEFEYNPPLGLEGLVAKIRDEVSGYDDEPADRVGVEFFEYLADWRALVARLDEVERLRDENRWVRAFNRLEAAVTHHKRATSNPLGDHEDADAALYKARDKILGDL